MCTSDKCDELEEKLLASGRCQKCPEYTYPNWQIDDKLEKGHDCISDNCDFHEFNNKQGKCEKCPAGQEADPTGRKCWKFLHGCSYYQYYRKGHGED